MDLSNSQSLLCYKHNCGRAKFTIGKRGWRCAECQILSLPVPLPVFSASSPKQPAIIGPPILYSPLHLSLPSLHPASCPLDTPATQCSQARLPPSLLAVVTWCLNSSSLNCATSTETLEWLSSLPVLMQESFWWEQCSDRHIISLFPHLHTPFSPSLISLMASVDFEHHVYLPFLGSAHK